MKKIRFIINPKSGTGNKTGIASDIEKLIDRSMYDADIRFTKYAGHATELADEAVHNGYESVVAVGGDGSVNETARVLKNTSTALGIIPAGSGNGMARHLGIHVDHVKAIALLNRNKTTMIDTLTVNENFCIGTMGIGFDAYIAHLFSKAKKRGYSTYVKLVLTEFRAYKERRFSILVDGKAYEKDCFLLTFANSSQFGNNAVIAPFADVKDGIIDISMMGKFPAIVAPWLIYRLMNNIIHKSRFFSLLRGRKIIVKNEKEIPGHIDGEPVTFNADIEINVQPASLKVIVP